MGVAGSAPSPTAVPTSLSAVGASAARRNHSYSGQRVGDVVQRDEVCNVRTQEDVAPVLQLSSTPPYKNEELTLQDVHSGNLRESLFLKSTSNRCELGITCSTCSQTRPKIKLLSNIKLLSKPCAHKQNTSKVWILLHTHDKWIQDGLNS